MDTRIYKLIDSLHEWTKVLSKDWRRTVQVIIEDTTVSFTLELHPSDRRVKIWTRKMIHLKELNTYKPDRCQELFDEAVREISGYDS